MPDPFYGRSPDEDFDAFLQMTHLSKGTVSQDPGEESAARRAAAAGEVITFAFKGKKTAALEASIQKGDAELGPATVLDTDGVCWVNGSSVATGCFTNNLASLGWFATPDPEALDYAGKWFVWAEVDIREDAGSSVYPSWTLNEGVAIAALEPEDGADARNIKWTRQKKILEITLVDGVITNVKNLQCGNIDIPRL